jgi:hypothetical protein
MLLLAHIRERFGRPMGARACMPISCPVDAR